MTGKPTDDNEGRLLPRPPLAVLTIFLLALAAAAPSLWNGFAFDDLPIIAQSQRIHRLDMPWRFFTHSYWGPPAPAALYRPLTSLAFAVQWRLGGAQPWIYHLVNVSLYLLISFFMYRFARLALGQRAGWWAAALFAANPVHAEPVGNSVGQSELWAALGVLTAMTAYLEVRRTRRLEKKNILPLLGIYAASCLFKEHALVLPLLFLAAEMTLFDGKIGTTLRDRGFRLLLAGLTFVAVTVWTAHFLVTGTLSGERPHLAFATLTYAGRLLTMLGVVPEWARLLFIPTRLKVEYLPAEILQARYFGWQQFLGVLLLLLAAGVAARAYRHRPAITFGVLWMAITLFPVSNVTFASGVLLAERTLFLASVGAALTAGAMIEWAGERLEWTRSLRRVAAASGVAVLVAGAVRMGIRQQTWKDNRSFYDQMLVEAPRSYRSHWIRAQRAFAARDRVMADHEFSSALSIFSDDPGLLAEAGDFYLATHRCSRAIPLYRRSVELEPRMQYLKSRMQKCGDG